MLCKTTPLPVLPKRSHSAFYIDFLYTALYVISVPVPEAEAVQIARSISLLLFSRLLQMAQHRFIIIIFKMIWKPNGSFFIFVPRRVWRKRLTLESRVSHSVQF